MASPALHINMKPNTFESGAGSAEEGDRSNGPAGSEGAGREFHIPRWNYGASFPKGVLLCPPCKVLVYGLPSFRSVYPSP